MARSYRTQILMKGVPLFLGPFLFVLLIWMGTDVFPLTHPQVKMLALAVWMLTWWLAEVVALSVTALLPLILIPLLGILSQEGVAQHYAHPLVFLFFGGFLLALGIEKWNLHRRISLWILLRTGTGPKQILLGFLITSALLSMWISNTATAVMLFPIALSVSKELANQGVNCDGLEVRLLLAVGYGANIGGIATLIGTPPNLILAGYLSATLQTTIGFLEWMQFGVPIMLLLLTGAFFILKVGLQTPNTPGLAAHNFLKTAYRDLGPLTSGAKRFSGVLFATILMWLFRPQLAEWFGIVQFSDTTVALLGGTFLFVMGSGGGGPRLLEWQDTKNLPWGILLLFGGGLALAAGLTETGLIDVFGDAFNSLSNYPWWAILLAITVFGIFATELLSNMALVTVMMPVLYGVSVHLNVPFLSLAIPMTIGSSCAFMLPMATPPNAIIFAGGSITIKQMATFGFFINLIAVVLVWGLGMVLG